MKYYLAARYSRKHELQGYADKLGRADCTSSWLYENAQCSALAEVPMFHHKNPLMTELAVQDLNDIDHSDVLVLFSDPMFPGQPRGSKHVEFGYALAQGPGLRCVVIGPLENLFHHLPCVEVFKNWEEFMEKEFPNGPPRSQPSP